MRKIFWAVLLTVVLAHSVVVADIVTQWNFNGASATTVPGGALAPTASLGAGTASLIGGTTASFASGIANGGSSDPVTTSPNNFGWNTTTYPGLGGANKTAGAQFLVSTVGFENITVSYDLRHSNTSSRFEQLQYTLDGTTWIDSTLFDGPAGDTWFNGRSATLTSITGANENPSFGIRVVAAYDPNGSNFAASNAGSTYAGGTWRFDMVTVSGTPTAIPEPATATLIGVAVVTGLLRRRKV